MSRAIDLQNLPLETSQQPNTARRPINPRITIGGSILLLLLGACLLTLPWTLHSKPTPSQIYYDYPHPNSSLLPPSTSQPWLLFGSSKLGQSLLGQCLLGGVISLTIGLAAAAISVFLGVSVGLLAGYRGGWLDSLLMRIVDILYALPYILTVILFKIALEPQARKSSLPISSPTSSSSSFPSASSVG